MGTKKLHEIIQSNINTLMEKDTNSSMRKLSTCIGASDGYIQKIMTGTNLPSLDKLEDISNHYDVEVWSLLYDYKDGHKEILPIIQQLNELPEEALSLISTYISFIKFEIEKTKKI